MGKPTQRMRLTVTRWLSTIGEICAGIADFFVLMLSR